MRQFVFLFFTIIFLPIFFPICAEEEIHTPPIKNVEGRPNPSREGILGVQIREATNTKISFKSEWQDLSSSSDKEKKFVLVIPPATNLIPEIAQYEIQVLQGNKHTPNLSQEGNLTEETITKDNITQYPDVANQLVPSTLIRISDLGYVRNYKLALVKIQGKLSVYGPQRTYVLKFIEGNFRFDKPFQDFDKNKSTDFKDDYFINLISTIAINKDSIKAYRDNNPPYVDITDFSFDKYYQEKGKWLKIDVDQESLVKIKGESILKSFLMKNCLCDDIHLYNKNAEVPIYIVDFKNDGTFDADDYIIFYGTPEQTSYTRHNIYWLSLFKDEKISRIEKQKEISQEEIYTPNPPREGILNIKEIDYTQQFEEDKANILEGKILEGQTVFWYWEKFDESAEIIKEFDLPELSESGSSGSIVLNFYNASTSQSNKYKIDVTVNGEFKREISLNKLKIFSEKLEIPANVLKSKTNKISFKVSQKIETNLPQTTPTPSEKEIHTTPQEVPPSQEGINPPPPREPEANNNQSPTKESPEIYLDNFQITYKRNLVIGKEYFSFSYSSRGGVSPPLNEGEETSPLQSRFQFKIPEGVEFVGFDVTDKLKPIALSFQPSTEGFSFLIKIHTPNPSQEGILEESKLILSAIDSIPSAKVEVDERSDLRDTQNKADMIIIYHSLFEDSAKKLEEFKKSRGSETKIVNVQDIYDEFNYGIFSPEAIRRFLGYALKNWSESQLKYVLLIGDATWDYLGDYRNGIINYVPSYIRIHSIENFACDLWFVNLIGKDSLPELEIGRISVNNKDDAENVVDKIINYEQNAVLQEWQRHFGYIADDSQGFDGICEKIIEKTPQAFISDRVYLDNYRFEDNFYVPKEKLLFLREKNKVSTECTDAIKEMFEKGVLLVVFYGHGAPNIWADERIWFGGDSKHSDNLRLTNDNRLFFIVQMTCSTSTIDYPITPWNVCIGEDMLRIKKGGAIGVFSPSGKGYTNWHERISLYMRDAIFEHNLKKMGDIIFNTQLSYFAFEDSPDMIEMFLLLGDPSVSLPIPDANIRIKPPVIVTAPGKKSEFSFECITEDFTDGNALVSLYDPDDKLIDEGNAGVSPAGKSYEIKSGRFSFAEMIPENAKEGRWLVRIYAVNIGKTKASIGSAEIFVSKPNFEIKKISVTTSNGQLTPDSNAIIHVTIKNLSRIELSDLSLKLTEKDLDREDPITSDTFKLKPEEEIKREYDYQVKSGLREITANLSLSYNGKDLVVSKTEIVPSFSTSMQPDLTTIQGAFDLGEKDFYEDQPMDLNFKIFNIGNKEIGNLEGDSDSPLIKVRLLDKDKNPVSDEIGIKKINANESAAGSLRLNKTYKKGIYNFFFQIDPENKIEESNKDNNLISIQIEVKGKPDLVITSDDIRFDNDNPTEGTTVFAYATVHNKGESIARDVRVYGYMDVLDDSSKMLRSKVVNKDSGSNDIKPGESQTFTIRWDPTENAGLHKIYFRANPLQINGEKDNANNIAYKELKVKTKINLVAGKLERFQTPEDVVNLRLKLRAEIENTGETDAVGVVVNYYKYNEQTDENLIGRTDVDVIKGGEEKIVEYVWQIDRKDADVKFKPSFNVGLRSSSQISQGYAEPPEEKNK